MVRFFIDRPIFAWVIALAIMLAGLLAIQTLPISQYPTVAPPAVNISTSYPGASAKTIEDSVTQVIEQSMQGLDGLSYMSASSNSLGQAAITLTFEAGTNPDVAQVQVQNKLQQALPRLPTEVQNQGVVVNKANNDFLIIVGLYSEDRSRSGIDVADFAVSNVQDSLARVEGVGEAFVFGFPYAMRIWLDPNKLNSYQVSPGDIRSALLAQNTQISVGQLGALPAVPGQQINATINARSRLQTPEQFGNVILRTDSNGAVVRLRDVARVEVGAESYERSVIFGDKAAIGIAIRMAVGANALATSDRVQAKVKELSEGFPPDIKYMIPYDTAPFVRNSIEEVVKTLVEAVVLVFLVMYLFLQSWRATLIPTIAVPVVLLGTFGVLAVFGYSINMLTMFATVLAIGLLVDDAIVVVENVERIMHEEHLSPLAATRKSMDQITGALVGIALVLAAVFVPMAFFGGSTGVIYRQFSITIVSAMVLSVIVALVLTPALCATLLKPIEQEEQHKRGFFGWFNNAFARAQHAYQNIVGSWIARSTRILLVFGLLVALMLFGFVKLPKSFLPDEDQGAVMVLVQMPVGATSERTLKVLRQVQSYFQDKEAANVDLSFGVAGFSYTGAGQNVGLAFVRLKDWQQRKGSQNSATAITQRANRALASIRDATIYAIVRPAIAGLGTASGFDLQLQDRAGLGHDALMQARNQLLGLANQDPNLVAVRPNGQEDTPQLQLDIDNEKATALGLSVADINTVLSAAWGGSYINDYIDRGRVKKVYMQGEASARMQPEDIAKWRVRNSKGDMVSLANFVTARWVYGPAKLERYNGQGSVEIVGTAAPGKSTGQAMDAIERLIAKLPTGIGYEWTGASAQERTAGSQAPALYALSIIVVFLSLAALYESWSIPFSVLLIVPLGILGAVIATFARGLSNDVYFQVGLLTTIGLSAKNAILIVEFAKESYARGTGLVEATLEAVRLRLRPILMTSFAFALGVLPLALANGAGSGAQNAIGTGVLGGMLFATALGIFFVPVFFVVVYRIFPAKQVQPEQSS